MLFLDYNSDWSTLINFKEVGPSLSDLPSTIEPPTGATGPPHHPFPPNGRSTVDLGYKRIWDPMLGTHVAIYDRLQPSGQRLVDLFRKLAIKSNAQEPTSGGQPTTGQVHANGVQHTYIKRLASAQNQFHRETTLFSTSDKGIWAKALKESALREFNVKSGNRDLATLPREKLGSNSKALP